MKQESKLLSYLYHLSLVKQIIVSLFLGVLLAVISPIGASYTSLLGALFVGSLKAVAPLLVFILVIASIASHKQGTKTEIKPILILYLLGTFSAALVAVLLSFLFPTTLILNQTNTMVTPLGGIVIVLKNLLVNAIDNPINALTQANFIGVLVWAIGLGVALRFSSSHTKVVLTDLSEAITKLVQIIIRLAPIGIFGLVSSTIAESGVQALLSYAHLLFVLIGSMFLVAFILNPIIVYWKTRSNPYPLVLTCLRESGITAFFTRSSAANIPINLALCEKLKIHQETYSISIPLGATINMAGAAITITVLTLAAAHTLNIQVDLATALLLSIVSSICACGASGVAGGSLLLIPLACSLFGIDNNLAMQVVAVGFIIGVLQDSFETGLNSSTDVLFTVAACQAKQR